jgi:hypothetical protein
LQITNNQPDAPHAKRRTRRMALSQNDLPKRLDAAYTRRAALAARVVRVYEAKGLDRDIGARRNDEEDGLQPACGSGTATENRQSSGRCSLGAILRTYFPWHDGTPDADTVDGAVVAVHRVECAGWRRFG